jgi:uncharacterized repeat protein (TIGR01451 family)
MGRRLLMIIGFALAVPCGVRPALAQQASPSPSSQPSSSVPASPEAVPPELLAPTQIGTNDEPVRISPPPLTSRPSELGRLRPVGAAAKAKPFSWVSKPHAPADVSGTASRESGVASNDVDSPHDQVPGQLPGSLGPLRPTATTSDPSPTQDPQSESVPPLPGRVDVAPRDELTVQAQAPGVAPTPGASNSMPPVPGEPATQGARPDNPFLLPLEGLPIGRQVVGLTVDVQAPSVVNINQETKLKIVVKNSGSTDAMRVVVRDQLPEGFEFVSSQPPAQPVGQILTWKLGTVAANSERVLIVKVTPKQAGSFDHSATVVILAGGRSTTQVQEPKLKIEQTVKPEKVLKGGQVAFKIAVSNPGTGPARSVVVQAKLSQGLHHEQGDHIEQTLVVIKPGERIELDPLIADAKDGGDQSCTVIARSPDVVQTGDDGRDTQTIVVVEPKLELKLSGPAKRFTDTVATYKLTLDNPGSAVAKNVKLFASIPVGGTVLPDTANSTHDRQYDRAKRRLLWTIPQIEPKGHVEISFGVRLGGIQLYQVAAEARAESPVFLTSKGTCSTDVTGMADVDFQVSERRRVLDVGEETNYEIRIKNLGSKEASRLLITAQLSDQLEVVRTAGLDPGEEAKKNPEGQIVFPQIDRLAPKGELVLTIRVRATKPGIATCQVALMHDDLENSKLARTAIIRVTAAADALTR